MLDASVASKWWLPAEPGAPEAVDLFARYAAGSVAFAVPDQFWSEATNVLWKAAGRRRLTADETRKAFSELSAVQCTTVPTLPLLPQALDLALRYRCSVYDAVYVVTALQLNSVLVTADAALARGLAAELPVKLLGAI